jgi:predicted nuclease of predicted toxin-antitoxin system
VRLLLDENLSEFILSSIADLYPQSLHVRLLDRGGASDEVVWRLAKEHGCILVTRDQDFLRLSMLLGPPPKVVWLDVGNCSNQDLIRLLRTRVADIEQFERHETAAFLTLEM